MLRTKVAPIQSNLLVCAIITYWDKSGRRRIATGINSEPCVIAGSLCAERSALTRCVARWGRAVCVGRCPVTRRSPCCSIMVTGFSKLDTVYITVSCHNYLTPGVTWRV
jgi:hypothetical protein